MNNTVLSCQQLTKNFIDGHLNVKVLQDLSLSVVAKQTLAILGASGSGKSTLLHLLGGLDKPTSGTVLVAGQDIAHVSERKRSFLRNRYLGFVYQFHHLLPEFTALENVCMPLLIAGKTTKQAQAKALHLINEVGLANRAKHKPAELSGGEKQRIAIARAMVTDPFCILADEPTGNLDNKTAHNVYELMLRMNEKCNTSLIIVTHDHSLARKMQSRYELVDGVLRDDTGDALIAQ